MADPLMIQRVVPWTSNQCATAASSKLPSGKLSRARPAITPAMPARPVSGANLERDMDVPFVECPRR